MKLIIVGAGPAGAALAYLAARAGIDGARFPTARARQHQHGTFRVAHHFLLCDVQPLFILCEMQHSNSPSRKAGILA